MATTRLGDSDFILLQKFVKTQNLELVVESGGKLDNSALKSSSSQPSAQKIGEIRNPEYSSHEWF